MNVYGNGNGITTKSFNGGSKKDGRMYKGFLEEIKNI